MTAARESINAKSSDEPFREQWKKHHERLSRLSEQHRLPYVHAQEDIDVLLCSARFDVEILIGAVVVRVGESKAAVSAMAKNRRRLRAFAPRCVVVARRTRRRVIRCKPLARNDRRTAPY